MAGRVEHAATLQDMREALQDWIKWSGDRGRQHEPPAMYDSDMAVYLNSKSSDQMADLRRNIEIMKQWAQAGK